MAIEVEVPGLGTVEFPDGMTTAQMESAIQNHLSQSDSSIDIGGSIKAFGVGAKTGLERGLHGYVQPTLESDRGAFREINDKIGTTLMGPIGKLSGIAAEQLAKYLSPEQLQNFNQSAKSWSEKIAQDRNAEYQSAAQDHPYAAGIGDFTGNVAAMLPAMAISPYSKATTAGNAANFALQNAIAARGNYVEGNDGFQRGLNMGVGAGVGYAAPWLLRGAQVVGNAMDGSGSVYDNLMNNWAARDVFAGIDPETALANKAAGDRAGVQLAPAEAGASPIAAGVQGRAGVTDEGSLMMQKFQKDRIAQERAAIKNLKENISPSKKSTDYVNPKPLYDDVERTVIPQKKFDALTQDELVARSLNNVKTTPEFSNLRKGLPENSMRYLDLAKQDMDTYINAAKTAKNKTAYGQLLQSKENLVTEMDKISKSYAPARQASQREIVGRNLEALLDNKDIGASAFYSKTLKSDKRFNELVAATKDMPGVTQKLMDMRVAFRDLINPTSTATSARLAKSSLDVPRSTGQFVNNILEKLTGGMHDKAIVKLITNPHWEQELLRIKKIPDINQRNLAFANLLSKAAASEYSSPSSP